MISTNDFKTGLTIELEGDVYQVIEFQHVKPGKGLGLCQIQTEKHPTGAMIENL